jgi:hypothetical protein
MTNKNDIIKDFVSGLKENYTAEEVNTKLSEIRNILQNKSNKEEENSCQISVINESSIKDQELRKIRKMLKRND